MNANGGPGTRIAKGPTSLAAADRRLVWAGKADPITTNYHTARGKNAPTTSVSAMDRNLTWAGKTLDPLTTAYHTAKQAPGRWAANAASRVRGTVVAADRGVTLPKWLQAAPGAPAAFNGYVDKMPDYNFAQLTPMGSNVGQAQTQSWGMDAAAQAQLGLIKDWGNENMVAAGEGEIARGMGRSGAYDAVRFREADRARMEGAKAIADAAAEQGRLNQQVVLQNAGNELARERANRELQQSQDAMASAYDQWRQERDANIWYKNADQNLAYNQFNEGQRQFNADLGFRQGSSDRDYATAMARLAEDSRQFDTGLGWDKSKFSLEQEAAIKQAQAQAEAAKYDPGYLNAQVNQQKAQDQMTRWYMDRMYGTNSPADGTGWMDNGTSASWARNHLNRIGYNYLLGR